MAVPAYEIPGLTREQEQHFWSRVVRGDPGECWLWTGYKDPNGYGVLRIGQRTLLAHRVAWSLFYRKSNANILICHSCDHPWCCSPAHLWSGTQKDNVADCWRKGRRHPLRGDDHPARKRPETRPRGATHYIHLHPEVVRGSRNKRSKLTERDIPAIRCLMWLGVSDSRIAAMYQVNPASIWAIRVGRAWFYVNEKGEA